MSTNPYLNWEEPDEQNLIEDLLIESISFYGQDVFYMPREIIDENTILNEVTQSKFDDYITVEVYQESVESYEGDGELFSKFGLELRNSMKLAISKRRFKEEAAKSNDDHTKTLIRPREGDLVYHAPTKGLYEIKFVDAESFSFYQLGKLPVYRMTVELFEYNSEDLDTGLDIVDDFQAEFTPQQTQLQISGFTEQLVLGSNVTFDGVTAELLKHNVSTGDIAIGPLTFDDGDWRLLVEDESITIGAETGTVDIVYDTLNDERFEELPFDETDRGTSSNSAIDKEFSNSLIDTSRNNPLI